MIHCSLAQPCRSLRLRSNQLNHLTGSEHQLRSRSGAVLRFSLGTREISVWRRCGLFDDLVGAGEDRRRDGEAERLGGLEMDDQLEFGGLLHRQIGRLGAAQDLSRVTTGLAIYTGEARSVAD